MNTIHYIVIFLIFIIILLWSHYVCYFLLIQIFWVVNFKVKLILFLTFTFLSISFFLASILAHYFNNVFTRFFYLISWYWLWFLINLFLALILAFLIFLVFKYFKLSFNTNYISIFLITLALVTTIYGWINASNFKINNITIPIKNLPISWQNNKIIQISDVHLWHVYRSDFLEKVIKMINFQKPNFVFITWDFFDWMDWDLDSFTKVLNTFDNNIWVYFVTWNHEGLLWLDKAFKELSKTKIKILNNDLVEIDWVQIIWISYWDKNNQNIKNIILNMKNFDQNKPHILLYHVPDSIEQIKEASINLQLSGHSHGWQLFPFNLITKLFYKWFDKGLYKHQDYYLYTSFGLGTWWPAIRTSGFSEIVIINLIRE